jgi:two-component system sensor histidine kinase RegB
MAVDTQTLPPPGLPLEADLLNFRWLVSLRWAAVVGQTITVLVVDGYFHVTLPLAGVATVLGLEVLLNVLAQWVSLSRTPPSEFEAALWVLGDLSAFTALLYLCGGPANPFSFFYILHVAMAALTLSAPYTWSLVLASVAGYASLFAWNVPLPAPKNPAFGREDVLLYGSWVAYALGASCIAYFMHRARMALRQREQLLAEQRELTVRAERLSSLTTLAAGAAHELSNPLSTIAVVSKELEHELPKLLRDTDAGASAVADVALMRSQVERCRKILGRMAHTAGQAPGETETWFLVGHLLQEAVAELPNAARVELRVKPPLDRSELFGPKEALAQALRVLVDNALDASTEAVSVVAELDTDLTIRVRDRGQGMPRDVLQRALEPFFTTKPPGKGMGLGLFLARNIAARLDGELSLRSESNNGTTAELRLPRRRVRPTGGAGEP